MHWTAHVHACKNTRKARSTYGAIPDTSLEDRPLDLATRTVTAKPRTGWGLPEPTEFPVTGNNNYKVLEAGDEKSDIGRRYRNVAINSHT